MLAQWPYAYFEKSEFDCRHTGRNAMRHSFMLALDAFRREWGKPMRITSGYRDPTHPVEARKTTSGGEHTLGYCCDVAVSAADRYAFVSLAIAHGFLRIGIAQTFVHLGNAPEKFGLPSPAIWTYANGT